MNEKTEDEIEFGAGRWVYCTQHLRPHGTGWCTVSPDDKILLDAQDMHGAYAEARSKGFHIHGEDG